MHGIHELIDKYLDYYAFSKDLLSNYVKMYGKDALYMKMNEGSTENSYINALGSNKVGFDYSSKDIQKIPVKLLVDYADWYKTNVGGEITAMLYMDNMKELSPNTGDMFVWHFRNKQLFYRQVQPTETYGDYLLRINLQLIQAKDIDGSNVNMNKKVGEL